MSVASVVPRRVRARVGGTVQGVGFRPYIYRLAENLNLSGFVLNDERGVLVEVEGEGATVDRFLERLPPNDGGIAYGQAAVAAASALPQFAI